MHATLDSSDTLPVLSAIILAGGEGRRMQGQDKGLMQYQGKPFVAWVKEALPSAVQQVIISCNRNEADYAIYGQTIHDQPSDLTYAGAMAGIVAALPECEHEWVIISPCDLIYYPTEFAQAAWTALNKHLLGNPQAAKIAVAHDGERRQNLCLFLHKGEYESLVFAQKNSPAIRHWLDARQALDISWPDRHAFININDPAILASLANP